MKLNPGFSPILTDSSRRFQLIFVVIRADCPLNDSYGSQLLSNGEEKLAERMIKDIEPRKSLGGWKYDDDIMAHDVF